MGVQKESLFASGDGALLSLMKEGPVAYGLLGKAQLMGAMLSFQFCGNLQILDTILASIPTSSEKQYDADSC